MLFEQTGVENPQDRAATGFAIYPGLLHMRRAGPSSTPRGRELDRYVGQVCDLLIHSAREPSRA